MSERFSKNKQSFSDTMQQEKSTFDVRTRELESQLLLKIALFEKLQEKLQIVEKDKFKKEFQIENLSNELNNLQQQREDEESHYNKVIDDQQSEIDTLKNQLDMKEVEIRKYMILESNMKT